MKYKIGAVLIVSIVLTMACNPDWEEHYNSYPETIDENVWNAMVNDSTISNFVRLLEDFNLDTLFESDIAYTIFAPSNEATEGFMDSITPNLLKYHLCTHVINTSSIIEKRKVQTLTKKFALFDRQGLIVLIDGVVVNSESPLYQNGRYLVMNEVIEPRPNLYEFYQRNNPILGNFIDSHDSVVLDRELSVPIGYDEDDNTIYDSVKNVINTFELDYFEVKNEFRDRSATFVFPLQEDYHAALNTMADNLGPQYTDYNDIPIDWQNNILLPYLINKGVFATKLEPQQFLQISPEVPLELENILGEFIVVDYTPVDKTICSNGYAYNYRDFVVPEFLYGEGNRQEGESLTVRTGVNTYRWNDQVNVASSVEFQPSQLYIGGASNDSTLQVLFSNDYSGEFSVEFSSPVLFPRKYVLEIRTHMNIGGLFEIYVDDELVRTFDYNEFIVNDGFIFSVEPDKYYLPYKKVYNSFDMYIENVVEYGAAKIRIEYKGPSNTPTNGLFIDYLEFRPTTN